MTEFALVSVPFRGFRGLQARVGARWGDYHIQVSVPFRGFRGLQARKLPVRAARELFQSPSGVLGVCRSSSSAVTPMFSASFQSPSGVLGVCRHCKTRRDGTRDPRVSVPFRGFRGLQVKSGYAGATTPQGVSVPFRGFRGLQACTMSSASTLAQPSFSPLPGF